ncbi:MAG: glycosyltransferase family 4 protein [Coriobacteriia bacterium]
MRVLVLSSYTKSLVWFRMNLMEDLVAAGHEVFALGSDDDQAYVRVFRDRGIEYRSFPVSRNGLSPVEDLRTYRELKRAIKAIGPDKIFVYQAKTIVYGCQAAARNGISEVYPLVAGLGSVFRGDGLRNRLIQAVLRLQYRHALKISQRVFFQNPDDRDEFVQMGLVAGDKVAMINGSGVDVDRFSPEPLPGRSTFLFIGRLLRDKGVVEYLEACSTLRSRYPEVRCLLVGPYDTNPSSLRREELEPYMESGVVEYLGEQEDVRPSIAECSVFVLPSYHEGTPKSVLEAMAMGRPIVTTDAPGCRETVIDGRNGFLVAPRAVEPLALAMERFIEEPGLASRMGAESRAIAQEKYDVHEVNRTIMQTMGIPGAQTA